MLFFYFLCVALTPSLEASTQSRFTVTTLGKYTPFLKRAESQNLQEESDEESTSPHDAHPLLPPKETSYIPVQGPLSLVGSAPTTPSDPETSSFTTNSPAIHFESAVATFKMLHATAVRYSARSLSKQEASILTPAFLEKTLQLPADIATETLVAAHSILQHITTREKNQDIDYLAQRLKSLSTLSPHDRTTVLKAEKYRDLPTLEEIHRTYSSPATGVAPLLLASSCFRSAHSYTDDSGTDTPSTATEKKRVTFSPAMFSSPSPQPSKKSKEQSGALDLLFGTPEE